MAPTNVTVEPPQLSVAPGTTAVAELRIANVAATEDRLTFEVVGDAASWVSFSPHALSVPPGDEATARIFFRPPRTPALSAGCHRVEIRVRSSDRSAPPVAVLATVEIGAFQEASLRLGPAPDNPRDESHLTIDNRGNTALRATVAGSDPTGAVVVTAEPSAVEIAPGARADVRIAINGRRPLVGSIRERPYTVTVLPDQGEPIRSEGVVRQPPVVTRRGRVVGAIVVAVVLVAVLLRVTVFSPSSGNSSRVATVVSNCPGAGHLAQEANGVFRSTVIEPDNYSFLFLQPGGCKPLRWNPCAAIHYVINGAQASAAQVADTRQAVADISQATGIQFVYDGETTATGRGQRAYDPTLFPGEWAPVLIDWTHLGGAANLLEVAGDAEPIEEGGVYVSGIAMLNLDAHLANNAPIPDGFGSGVTWGRLVLHELGHIVGLGHVTDVNQIMHEPITEQVSPTSAYGDGDLAGLRYLGKSAGCLTTPPVPTNASATVPTPGD